VPGAGHFSRRELQARNHSASVRAGTVLDGQNQQIATKPPRRDHRGWSPHMAASRNKPAKPNPASNRNFIPSGEIGAHAMHPPGKRSIDINKGQNHHDKAYRHRYARADTAVRPYAEICSMKGQPNTGHRQSNIETNQRDGGWNGERMCREPDISADGGCKPGIIRRLAGRAPSSMVKTSRPSKNHTS